MLNDRQVVRNEQVREAAVALQVAEQVDDLGLHRDVERRNRFVADDELRLDRQRPGDADALPLPAGKFVRILRRIFTTQPDFLEELPDALIGGRAFGETVHGQSFADSGADGHPRVQRGERVLEDDLHVPAHFTQVPSAEAADIDAVEPDVATGRLDQPEDAAAERRLAAAGFSHDA